MKKVIITGAAGFIGKALLKYLLKFDYQVFAFVRDKAKMLDINSNNLVIIETDLSKNSLNSQIKHFKNLKIDAVIHLAWGGYGKYTNDYDIQIDNIKMSCSVAEFTATINAQQFIFAGSSHQYLKLKDNYSSVYGMAKTCAENFIKLIFWKANVNYNTVFFTNVFGVGDYSARTANLFISSLLQGEELDLIQGNSLYDWVYIDDVVAGIKAVLEFGKDKKNYYIGHKHLRTFKDIITDVRNYINPYTNLNFGKYQDDNYIDYQEIDLLALYNDTGFEAKADFKESILKTAEWLKNNKIMKGT